MRWIGLILIGLTAACAESGVIESETKQPRETVEVAYPFDGSIPSDNLPQFTTFVPDFNSPTLLEVRLCSYSRKNCIIPDSEERCSLEGASETIFEATKTNGYLVLGDEQDSHQIKLKRIENGPENQERFISEDGALTASLAVTYSKEPRGRATGPGRLGMLSVALNGEPVPYNYPTPRKFIDGPFDCYRDGKQTR